MEARTAEQASVGERTEEVNTDRRSEEGGIQRRERKKEAKKGRKDADKGSAGLGAERHERRAGERAGPQRQSVALAVALQATYSCVHAFALRVTSIQAVTRVSRLLL